MKRNKRELLYDRLHKGFVLTSVAVTLGTSVLLAMRVYHYFTVEKPLRRQLQLERDQQLLNEGMDTAGQNSQLKL